VQPLALGRDGEQSMGAQQSASGFDALTGLSRPQRSQRTATGNRMVTHPQFRVKLEASTSTARFASGSTIALVPILLAALLIVRGPPALVYRSTIGDRQTVVAGLLQTND
jgi:hypothetical protein